jgi:hypothetical protein
MGKLLLPRIVGCRAHLNVPNDSLHDKVKLRFLNKKLAESGYRLSLFGEL